LPTKLFKKYIKNLQKLAKINKKKDNFVRTAGSPAL
jgi:hypothetical protein